MDVTLLIENYYKINFLMNKVRVTGTEWLNVF